MFLQHLPFEFVDVVILDVLHLRQQHSVQVGLVEEVVPPVLGLQVEQLRSQVLHCLGYHARRNAYRRYIPLNFPEVSPSILRSREGVEEYARGRPRPHAQAPVRFPYGIVDPPRARVSTRNIRSYYAVELRADVLYKLPPDLLIGEVEV